MRVELLLNTRLRRCLVAGRLSGGELHVAEFAHSKNRDVFHSADNPEITFYHTNHLVTDAQNLNIEINFTLPIPSRIASAGHLSNASSPEIFPQRPSVHS